MSLYGSVAAVIRGDWFAAELLQAHLINEFGEIGEIGDLLILIALTTLERIEEAPFAELEAGPSCALAREMLETARTYHPSSHTTIHAAAWRLEAVRSGDPASAAADIELSRSMALDSELMRGSIALLAGIVTVFATRNGRLPEDLATELCLTASLAAAR
ncbi:MAG: hypothetical protein JWL72_1377 [Ilumatobacteraceae bacterium]|nr:hypothetical protein [Ilumatobacteraceae bacterium]